MYVIERAQITVPEMVARRIGRVEKLMTPVRA
jgi:hypothetical protein